MVAFSSFNLGFALPLESVSAEIIDFDGTYATVQLAWNHNDGSYYKAGCVSCIPNFSNSTEKDVLVLDRVTAFADGSALLYVIAYDTDDQIISAKQLVLQLQ